VNGKTVRRATTAVVLTLLVLTAAGVAGAAEPVFEQNFDGLPNGADASVAGFTVNATPDQSVWTVQDGYLHGLLHRKPHEGGYVTVGVPKLERGRLDYRVWLGSENYRHCGFQVRPYGIFTYYHGYGGFRMTWRRHASRYIDGVKRERDIALQTRIAPGEWCRCRIEWDAAKMVISYFVDDMENPSYVDTKVAIFSDKDEINRQLVFGNFGLCSGDIEVRIDDIKLYPVEAAKQGEAERKNVIVVDGFDYAKYKVREAFEGYDAGRMIRFPVVFGLGGRPKIMTRLDKIITGAQLSKAKLLIMTNASALCLEPYTRQELLAQVKDGGLKVLMLGGLFSLGKGQYEGTEFMELCPVGLKGKWSVKAFDTPQVLKPAKGMGFASLDWSKNPAALFYEDVNVPEDAEVWLKAGDVPILVVRKIGKGYVAALLTQPIGKAPGGTLAYWNWKDWPKLLREVSDKLMEKGQALSAPQNKGEQK